MAEGRIHVIGNPRIILPFRAAGALLHPAEDPEAVAGALGEIGAVPGGSLVLITEEAAARAPDAVREFEEKASHAIMIIPARREAKSRALERVRGIVIRSVGVDLIAKAPGAEIPEEIVVGEEGHE